MAETTDPASRGLAERLVRFAGVGVSSTVLSFAVYVLLSRWWTRALAYATGYAAGLGFQVVVTGRFVHGTRPQPRSRAAFAVVNLTVFGIGLMVLDISTRLGAGRVLAGLFSVLITAPLNYLGGRLTVGRTGGQ